MPHDSLNAAGCVVCRRCGHRSYPSDAIWLNEHLILAAYEPACAHIKRGAFVVDVDQLARDTRFCGALTRTTGLPCRQRAGETGRCWLHTRADR
jgi:hypothetical protein